MREIRIKVPEGRSPRIVALVQKLGVQRVGVSREFVHGPDRVEEVLSVETSTPQVAQVVDELEREGLLEGATISVRELRALVSSRSAGEVTVPLEVPPTDLDQDLWQFCHVTYGHVGRVVVAALILSYAMMHGSVLLTAGGLLFLPGLPHLLAIGRGLSARDPRLARQGAFALSCTIAILVGCGALMGALMPGPIRFGDFLSLPVAACLSVGIGVAGALASLDDVGKRELIGLATASQVGMVPAWLGICFVHGFDSAPGARLGGYVLNLAIMIATSALVYGLVRLRRRERGSGVKLEPSALSR